MGNFRCISLCTILYKVSAKAMVNRLQHVLNDYIDNAQSAFVLECLFFDNVLVGYELMHTFKHKRIGSNGYMSLKLDMNKAYHKVEWKLLELMMECMRFARSWVKLILRCISLVSYSIVVNSVKRESFNPSRSLRQGVLSSS